MRRPFGLAHAALRAAEAQHHGDAKWPWERLLTDGVRANVVPRHHRRRLTEQSEGIVAETSGSVQSKSIGPQLHTRQKRRCVT